MVLKTCFEESEQFTGNDKRKLIVGWLDHEGLHQLQNSFVVDENLCGQTSWSNHPTLNLLL